MKRLTTILAAVLAAVCLSGCEEKTQERIDDDMASHITEFNYKGHRYIRYISDGMNSAVGGITHDPDCPCRHNRHAKNMHDNPDAPVAMGAQHEPQTITLRHMLADTAFQNQLHQASERAAAEATARTAEARRRAIGFSHILTKGGEQ